MNDEASHANPRHVAVICQGDEKYGVGTVIRQISTSMPGLFYICMKSGPLEQELRRRGESVHVVQFEPAFVASSSVKTLLRLPREFRQAKAMAQQLEPLLTQRQIRIVHVHWLPHQIIAGYLRRRGYRSIWHIHNNMNRHRLFGLGVWMNNRLARWGADRILPVSQFISENYRTSGVRRVVIHNAADEIHTQPSPQPALPVRCIIAGRLSVQKGQHVAIRGVLGARKRGLDVRLDVLGGPTEDNAYLDELKQIIAEATGDDPGAADAIAFLGFRDDLRQLHPNYHLGLQCRIDPEPCSIWVCETLVDGLPLIAADLGGTRELVAHGTTGLLVRPSDPQALTEALLQLAGDLDTLAQMRQATWERGQTHFRLDRFARELDQLYAHLLESQ